MYKYCRISHYILQPGEQQLSPVTPHTHHDTRWRHQGYSQSILHIILQRKVIQFWNQRSDWWWHTSNPQVTLQRRRLDDISYLSDQCTICLITKLTAAKRTFKFYIMSLVWCIWSYRSPIMTRMSSWDSDIMFIPCMFFVYDHDFCDIINHCVEIISQNSFSSYFHNVVALRTCWGLRGFSTNASHVLCWDREAYVAAQ